MGAIPDVAWPILGLVIGVLVALYASNSLDKWWGVAWGKVRKFAASGVAGTTAGLLVVVPAYKPAPVLTEGWMGLKAEPEAVWKGP